ncbi:thiosulfate sulfurtransferase [Trichuris trichiura]|uniref:Thiosulfate sulfurtransferase n=1 Tax=Trichuris trichiura TaxID=36087 RepID=A0A077YZL7_TRITR|nr:thiosulfate sulfurtransferase [Trichuris trichiura]
MEDVTLSLATSKRDQECDEGSIFSIAFFQPFVHFVIVLIQSEIQKAYRQLARKYHPDKQKDEESKAEAQELFRLVATAYETLKDEESRKNYDYMLDNPAAYGLLLSDEVYRHYWYYYRHRVTPKVDVRIVIVAIVVMISVVQYVSSWHKYEDAVKYMSSQAKYRIRAKEIAKERGYLEMLKSGKRRKDKEEMRLEEEAIIRAVIKEFADISCDLGGYQKPSIYETLAVKIVLLPVALYRWIYFQLDWFWRITIRRQELGKAEKFYLIRRNLQMSKAQFDCLEDHERESFLEQELWIKEKFLAWKEEKEAKEKAKLLESGQYKRMKRYMRRGVGQITFVDDEYSPYPYKFPADHWLQMKIFSFVCQKAVKPLVSADWLADHLSNPTLRILHCSKPGLNNFAECHIPKAVHFDLKQCIDKASPYPNMLPSSDQFFSYACRSLGVDKNNHVVVYDASVKYPSLECAARVWFTFRYFNHSKVSVLNGGLFHWKSQGRPVTSELSNPKPTAYEAAGSPLLSTVKSFDEVLSNVKKKTFQLLDARPSDLFAGNSEKLSGHIPGAINIPLASLINPKTKLILQPDELRNLFLNAGVNLNGDIVCSCGTGVTACAIILALNVVGKENCSLYDGSFSQWVKLADEELVVKE